MEETRQAGTLEVLSGPDNDGRYVVVIRQVGSPDAFLLTDDQALHVAQSLISAAERAKAKNRLLDLKKEIESGNGN